MRTTANCLACPHDQSNVNIGCFSSGTYTTYRDRSIDFPDGGASFTGCGSGYDGQCSFKDELSNGTLVGSVKGMQKLIADANTLNNRTALGYPLKFALTEMNIAGYNPPNPGGSNVEDNSIVGLGNQSFFAGQYWVDMCASMLKNSGGTMEFIMPWGIHESGGAGTSTDHGFLKETATVSVDPLPLSAYWHYQQMATKFADTFYANTEPSSTSSQKAFAYKNTSTNEIGVMIINEDLQSPRGDDLSTKSFKINFNGNVSGSENMLFEFACGINVNYSCNITNETTLMLFFNGTTGAFNSAKSYSLQDALRPVDTGFNTWGSSSATVVDLSGYTAHPSTQVFTTISIAPTSNITANVDRVFLFESSTTISPAALMKFELGAGQTLSIIPTTGPCH